MEGWSTERNGERKLMSPINSSESQCVCVGGGGGGGKNAHACVAQHSSQHYEMFRLPKKITTGRERLSFVQSEGKRERESSKSVIIHIVREVLTQAYSSHTIIIKPRRANSGLNTWPSILPFTSLPHTSYGSHIAILPTYVTEGVTQGATCIPQDYPYTP